MSITQNYRVSVLENGSERFAIFYRNGAGQFDLRFGWGRYTSSMHSTLEDAIIDFRNHLQREHDDRNDGVSVSLADPIAITEQAAKEFSPAHE